MDIQEAMERLNLLSFDQIVSLNKAKLMNKVNAIFFIIYILLSICHIKYIIQFIRLLHRATTFMHDLSTNLSICIMKHVQQTVGYKNVS